MPKLRYKIYTVSTHNSHIFVLQESVTIISRNSNKKHRTRVENRIERKFFEFEFTISRALDQGSNIVDNREMKKYILYF